MKNEAAKPIPGFDGYRITEDGRVFSVRSRWHRDTEHELKPWHNQKGYLMVGLTTGDGKTKTIPVHKLQELTFLGGPKPGLQIDHIDGNKENNSVSNLHQVTPRENTHNPITKARHQSAMADEAFREKQRQRTLEKFKDAKYRKRVVEGAHKRINDPTWQLNHSEAMKEVWSRQEMREMIYRNLDKMNNDPKMRAFNASRSKEVNSRPCKAVNQNGEELIFPSVTECAQYFGVGQSTITRHMRLKLIDKDGWRVFRPDKEQS